jgi:uncharacterized membrane protein
MTRFLRIGCAALLFAVASCQGSGDLPLDQVDPDAVAQDPTFDQVNAIMHRACVPCHQGEGDDGGDNGGYALVGPRTRLVAEDAEPNLEDCAEIVAQRFSILEQVEANSMPPGAWPRLTNEEKLIVRRWIDDGAPAPCN